MIPILGPLLNLLPKVADGVVRHFEHKQEMKAAEQAGKLELRKAEIQARIKRLENADAADIALDRESVATRGWKDEYLLIVTTSPLVLLFLGPLLSVGSAAELTAAVMAGFDALQHTPTYYWYALAIVYIDTFGMRRIVRELLERKFLK